MKIEGAYDHVVSLGRGCQPAHQIRRCLGANAAHVFDWIVTTDDGLVELIGSGLEFFFSKERLGMGPENCVVDIPTGTQFLHEFPRGCDIGEQHDAHADRFSMLTARWRDLLSSEQSVLFVRQHGWDPNPRAAAQRLRGTLERAAPLLRFSILYLTHDAVDSWNERRIVNRRLAQCEPYDWRGDDRAWTALLTEALSMAPLPRRLCP